MYSTSSSSSYSDIATLFSDDFFNSSIVYNISKSGKFSFHTSYLLREDLIANKAYGDSNMLGTVLMGVDSTVEYEDGKVKRNIVPLSDIDLLNSYDISRLNSRVVNENPLTSKDLSTYPPTLLEKEYSYDKTWRVQPNP